MLTVSMPPPSRPPGPAPSEGAVGCIPFPDTLALEKNAAVLNSASPRGLALLSTGVFLTVRENGMHPAAPSDGAGPGGRLSGVSAAKEGIL